MSTNMISLSAQARVAGGKGAAKRLRRTGGVPAVTYGKGHPATPITVGPKDVLAVLNSERGKNTVIQMNVGGAKDLLVMIREYSYHPLTRSLEHVDFVEVKLDEEIDVEIPLVFTGKPAGLAQGGLIRQVYRTVPIRTRPDLIPVKVTIDIAHLNLGEHVATQDLKLPQGVAVRLPAEQTLIAIVTPEKDRSAEEEAAATAAAPGAAGAAAPAAGGAAAAKTADAKAPAAKDAKPAADKKK